MTIKCQQISYASLLLFIALASCSGDDNSGNNSNKWDVGTIGDMSATTTDAASRDATSGEDAATPDAASPLDQGTTDFGTQPMCEGVADSCEVEGAFVCTMNGARECSRDAAGCLVLGGATTCDDSNPCTNDSCVDMTGCENTPNTDTCDDGDLATGNDTCADSACTGTVIECVATQCIESSAPNGTDCDVVFKASTEACDDGDPNTADDLCDGAGTCVGQAVACVPTQCEASATVVGTQCVRVAKSAGDACNDGDLATANDICDASNTCAGTPIMCTPGTCEASSTPNGVGCDVVMASAGAACNDQDLSTSNDVCDAAGACAGTPIVCTPGVCESASNPNGTDCTPSFEVAGTSCDDNNLSTGSDVCNGSGGCSGTPIVCTPGQCDVSSTPNGVDCDVVPKTAGTTCNDQNLGTANDVCDGNSGCSGTTIVCPSGQCVVSSVPNGVDCDTVFVAAATSCNDGRLNTRNDVCNGAGTCAGQFYTCPSPVMCQLSNTPNGVDCTLVNLPNGSNCSDNETCTVNDRCQNGICVSDSLCGNGSCDAICGENAGTCQADCLTTVGQCDASAGENACTDWADCHSNTTGNGLCANIGCGGGQVGNCFCGVDCIQFGDCCQDMQAVCGCN